jgi:hypothetical protein
MIPDPPTRQGDWVSFQFRQAGLDILGRVIGLTGGPIAGIIRAAVTLYLRACEAEAEGLTLAVLRPDGSVVKTIENVREAAKAEPKEGGG